MESSGSGVWFKQAASLQLALHRIEPASTDDLHADFVKIPNLHSVEFHFSRYLDSMKTSVDIPDAALADAMRFTGAKTKREAVGRALEEFNRQQLVKEVVASFGTWDIATNDEVEAGDMEEIASGKPKIGIRTIQ
jgi:hypothetical protein